VVLPGRIENPWALAYDSAKGTIFCTSGNNDMDGTVFVISDSSKDVIANLTQPPVPTGLQVSYSSPFDMYPMYLDKHPSDASITEGYAGAGPHGIVYDPTKGTIFIVNNNAGNVSAVPDDQILPSSPSIVPEFTPETIILIITIISLIFITLVRLKSKIMK
jgi:DNA-binding beta-propeller fold protein YncE